jgi:hypothetical protein
MLPGVNLNPLLEVPLSDPSRPSAPRKQGTGRARTALGWARCLLVGSVLAMSYLGAVVVFGWLCRWVQGRVLHGWWRRSPLRQQISFDQFCAESEPDAPCLHPRWLLRQGVVAEGMRGWHLFHSLWLNLRVGFLGLLSTFLLLGSGCLLMTFSWEYGWQASFDKIDEVRHIGRMTAGVGIALFMLAMVYVPMAQVHQAVTGDFRAFFEFRFIGQLIRARLGSYVVFAILFLEIAVVLENLKTIPTGLDDHLPLFSNASDQELQWLFRAYYLGCSFVLLLSLLVTRLMVLRLYGSAVLRVLRRGWVSREQLHPRLIHWLSRLELVPETRKADRVGLGHIVRCTVLLVVLLAGWFGFVAKVYVGEFFNYHPVVGFLNHPLIQVPCCNYLPAHLGRPAEEAETPARGVHP